MAPTTAYLVTGAEAPPLEVSSQTAAFELAAITAGAEVVRVRTAGGAQTRQRLWPALGPVCAGRR